MIPPQHSSYSTALVGKQSTDRLVRPEKSEGKAKNRVKIVTQEAENKTYLIALNSLKIYDVPKETFFDKLLDKLGLRKWIYIPFVSPSDDTKGFVRVNAESLRKRFNFSNEHIKAIKNNPGQFKQLIGLSALTFEDLNNQLPRRMGEIKKLIERFEQLKSKVKGDRTQWEQDYLAYAEINVPFFAELSRKAKGKARTIAASINNTNQRQRHS